MTILHGFLIYWVIGMLWLITGFLPRPFGWLRHNIDPIIWPLFIFLFVVIGGLVWPFFYIKLLRGLLRGERDMRPF